MYRLFIIASLIVFLSSCRKDQVIKEESLQNQFIVIGHAYGNPVSYQLSLYHKLLPLLAATKMLINPEKFIFTGDIVAKATAENWENVEHQLDSLGIDNYWIAPGNHDLGSSYFLDNVQSKAFFAERIDNNLLLILNTNYSGWTVSQAQIDLIYAELSNLEGVDNILVFSHQVWWAKTLNAVYNIDPIKTNSEYLLEGDQSFWSDAFPLFQNTNLPTYFFAGDVGCWDFIPAFVVNQFDNFHFYASGVGGGAEDNVINIKTYDSGKVVIDRINF